MPRDELIVSEWFGPTIQGEGPSAGRVAAFLRLGLCNLDCSWCDTPYTWDWTGKNGPPQDRGALLHVPVDVVRDALVGIDAPLWVVTGGEPLMQRKALVELLKVRPHGTDVEFETNGTRGTLHEDERAGIRYNVSPKLTSSGVDAHWADLAMKEFALRSDAVFKFVVADPRDFHDARRLVEAHDVDPSRVWIMPEGRRPSDLVAPGPVTDVAELAISHRYNFTNRLHVLLWEDVRGR